MEEYWEKSYKKSLADPLTKKEKYSRNILGEIPIKSLELSLKESPVEPLEASMEDFLEELLDESLAESLEEKSKDES